MEFIVDIQGFENSYNELIVKELSLIALGFDSIPTNYMFKPPFEWNYLSPKRQNKNSWLVKNYHGLSWDLGDFPYCDLTKILRRHLEKASKVYVKGLQKRRFLERFISNIINTDDLGCPYLQKITQNSILCDNHRNWKSCFAPNCAVRNVMKMNDWLVEYCDWSAMNFYKEVDNTDSHHENCEKKFSDCHQIVLKNNYDDAEDPFITRYYDEREKEIKVYQIKLENSFDENKFIPNCVN